MPRYFSAIVLAGLISSASYSQDSGPGPDPAAGDTQKQYDVVLYQRTSTQKGSLLFFAASDTLTASTTGDLESDVNGESLTGTWRAYDLGTFSFWHARATGDASGSTSNFSAIGLATPDFVVGQATEGSRGGIWSLLGWLFGKTYFLHGTAATTPVTVN